MRGGRPLGSSNKNKRLIKQNLKDAYGDDFDVIMMMGQNCRRLYDMIPDDPTEADVDLIIDANTQLDKLAQYIEPKLKAIEVSGNVDSRMTLVVKDMTGAGTGD